MFIDHTHQHLFQPLLYTCLVQTFWGLIPRLRQFISASRIELAFNNLKNDLALTRKPNLQNVADYLLHAVFHRRFAPVRWREGCRRRAAETKLDLRA